MDEDIKKELKFDGRSFDNEQSNRDRLKTVFPECFLNDEFDVDKLLALCGEYIENEFERYNFQWKGKADCLKVAQQRSTGTLRPCVEESVNFHETDNLYIEGDNLEVLKLMQTAYFGKVKMIYIDPPYNTGHDFVYEDDFKDPIATYKEVTSQATKSNSENMGRFHTNWLNMMYPRLRIASNLLSEDGVIFISIDDNEVHNLRKVCDEVFGEENFLAQIIWERAFAPVNLKKHFSENHDFILCYAKNIDLLESKGLKRTQEADDRYSNPDNDPRGIWQSDNFSVGPAVEKNIYKITSPSGRENFPPNGRSWRVSEEKFEEMLKDNRVWFGADGNNTPRQKRFLCDVKNSVTPMTIWKYKEVGHTQDATKQLKELFENTHVFDYSKTIGLIKRCLELYASKDCIILDFFSGSATTAHAVMQLNAEDGGNRKFICVQLPEVTDEKSEAYKAGYRNICEIGKERIRRAGAKILEENPNLSERETPLDIGFKCFKLDTSNLQQWDNGPLTDEEIFEKAINHMLEGIKLDRSNLDIVFEVMIKMGIPLDTPVTHVDINDKTMYAVGDFLLLICLEGILTVEDIEIMIDEPYLPPKVVIVDRCFADDSIAANAYYLFKNSNTEFKIV